MDRRQRSRLNTHAEFRSFWGRIGLATLAGLLFCLVFMLIGMNAAEKQTRLYRAKIKIKSLLASPSPAPLPYATNSYDQLVAYPDKVEVPRPRITDKTIVAFVFGQSNASNFGGEKYSADGVFNYFDGKFYAAADPLLGACGNRGSVWTLAAGKWIALGLADQVIVIPAGVDGKSVNAWKKGAQLRTLLEKRLQDAQTHKLPITHFLWHQGETDHPANPDRNKATLSEYTGVLSEIIELTKTYYPSAKFFVARATRSSILKPSPELQKAQSGLTKMEHVFLGPNTDLIGNTDRYDDCHFSARGLEKHAQGWVDALKSPRKTDP